MTTMHHTFHIPVMGTGFTLDTPLKVAPLGIDSTISLVDDVLIEHYYKHYCERFGREPQALPGIDCRAERIRLYLDLLEDLIEEAWKASKPELVARYRRLLPDVGEDLPRGSIDANIMVALDADRTTYPDRGSMPLSDALSAAQGYLESRAHGTLVLSAGVNKGLYDFLAAHEQLHPDADGHFSKKLALKVSDYRSARIQGTMLAKLGLWVSEFRVESGLNCGGHAYPTPGILLGPALADFQENRETLYESLYTIWQRGLEKRTGRKLECRPRQMLTAQGGVGTYLEHKFLIDHYGCDRTGWGTPFLLVPEVVNIDQHHLKLLCEAKEGDTMLSAASPLGIPFWTLMTSTSEQARLKRNQAGKPGTTCPKGYARLNTEVGGLPLCTASRQFIKAKLKDDSVDPQLRDELLARSCICHELGTSAYVSKGLPSPSPAAVCPGPNIKYFSRQLSLEELVDHIYGRLSVMDDKKRPHMFIEEARQYLGLFARVDSELWLKEQFGTVRFKEAFATNFLAGLSYYQQLAGQFLEQARQNFLDDLEAVKVRAEQLFSLTAEA